MSDIDNDNTIDYDTSILIELPQLQWAGPSGWKNKAACKGVDTSLFFQRRMLKVPKEVAKFCNACPVRLECLEFAIRNDLPNGVYGGLTKTQRKGISLEDIKV